MRAPKGGRGRWDGICRWLLKFYERPLVKYLLAPASVALPPWLVNTTLNSRPFGDFVETLSPPLASAISKYGLLFLVLATLYSWLVLKLGKSIASRVASRQLDFQSLLVLLASIAQVVGSKLERFTRHVGEPGLTKETAFETITQPALQISELVRAISDYFNAQRAGIKLIRVVLAEMNETGIEALPVYFPKDEPVRAEVAELNKANSAIMTAFRLRRIVVIESIQKELRKRTGARYVTTGAPEDNEGSMISFPVTSTGSKSIPYVVSVHCDEEGYFKEGLSQLYEYALAQFALRINLEHGLLQLKERLCEPT